MYHRSLLIGMLLGDGCIKLKQHIKDNGKKSTYAEYVITHGPAQYEYLDHKRKVIHSIVGGKPLNINKEYVKINGPGYVAYRINRCHKYFRLLHRWAYSNKGKKYFSRPLLDKLTPEGIAYWYMDDGGVDKTKNKITGKITSATCNLSTYCSEEEANNIITYFKEVYDIDWRKRLHKKSGLWFLSCNTKQARKFEYLIRDYIHPSMKYKLPNSYATRQQGTSSNGEEIV